MTRLPKLKFLVIALLCLSTSMFMPQGTAHAYYGGLYGGYGLYGGGLYGAGLYGGYGLYGGGLYGGYGLYGGGLYGGYGLYGGGLYGGYGLYGGGLYGAGYGLYGGLAGRSYLGNGSEALTRTPDIILTGGTGGIVLPTATATPTVTITIPVFPDPTGIYAGTWTSTVTSTSNAMSMNITYDILSVSITGTAGLLLNKLIPIAINVSGFNNAPTFTLSGTYLNPTSLITYSMDLTCSFSPATLTLPAIINGAYYIHDPLFLKVDTGTFSVGRL